MLKEHVADGEFEVTFFSMILRSRAETKNSYEACQVLGLAGIVRARLLLPDHHDLVAFGNGLQDGLVRGLLEVIRRFF